jgi:hypothetical protein
MTIDVFSGGVTNVGTLLSTTLSHYVQNNLEDQIFSSTPLLSELYKNKKTADGGADLRVPLMYEVNGTSTWYSGYDVLNTTPQAGMTDSRLDWRNLATSISIAGDEERKNSGKARLTSLLEAKTYQAEMTLKKDLTSALFAASTGTKAITTLVEMIDATSSIQEINSTTYSWWQAQVTASVGSFATGGLSAMRAMYTAIAKTMPETVVDTIVTTDTIYNYYEGSLTPQTRFSPSDKVGDASFETLKFKSAKVFYDASCTSGALYMFPSKNLFLITNSNADMKKTEFVKPSNQDARVAQIIVMCAVGTNARRKLGKLTSITA